MSRNFFLTRSIMVVVVVSASAASVTRADDSSLGRFSGDTNAYFDQYRPVVSNMPSFRQTHPNGLSDREYQGLSSPGPAWHTAPIIDRTPATFRQSHPNGLSEAEYQALSSNSSRWQLAPAPSAELTQSTNAVSKAVTR